MVLNQQDVLQKENKIKRKKSLPPLENYNLFVSLLVQKLKNHLHSWTAIYFLSVRNLILCFNGEGGTNL